MHGGKPPCLTAGYEAKAKHFDNAALSRDLSAVHVMVTGANQGIGYATCKQMANQKAHVHMVGRCSSTLL